MHDRKPSDLRPAPCFTCGQITNNEAVIPGVAAQSRFQNPGVAIQSMLWERAILAAKLKRKRKARR